MIGLKRESREDGKNQKRIDALGKNMRRMGKTIDELQKFGKEDNPVDIDCLIGSSYLGLS